MHIFSLFILTFCFFLFLLCLYGLVSDDFILFRKHITTERIFNIGFLIASVALFFARLFYVFFHFAPGFLNPLVFFLFPYFPGLSFAGGIIGGVLFLLFVARQQELPLGKFLDFFALSLFCTLPLGLFLEFIATKKTPVSFVLLGAVVVTAILFALCLKLFKKSNLKEGSTGLLSVLCVSLAVFVTGFVGKKDLVFFFLNGNDFLLIGIFLVSLGFLIKQEQLLLKVKKIISGLINV